MIRTIAALAVGICVFWAGLSKSRTLSERVGIAEAFADAGRTIASDIKARRGKAELLSRLPLTDAHTLACAEKDSVAELIENSSLPLNQSEASQLTDYIYLLGGGTQEEQLILTECFTGFWERAAAQARRDKSEKGRLFVSLGGLAGLAAAIILI